MGPILFEDSLKKDLLGRTYNAYCTSDTSQYFVRQVETVCYVGIKLTTHLCAYFHKHTFSFRDLS